MSKRFNFMIERIGDEAVIAMDLGDGIFRVRNMPLEGLELFGDLCREIRERVVNVIRADPSFEAPASPSCRLVAKKDGFLDVCDVRVVVCEEDGQLEISTAFYDAGDDTAPVLLLTDEQLDEFIEKTQEPAKAGKAS